MKVYIIHRWSEPYAVFSTKEAAALWVYEHSAEYGYDGGLQIAELELDPPRPSPTPEAK